MPAKAMLEQINAICSSTIQHSLEGDRLLKVNYSCALGDDLNKWAGVAAGGEKFLIQKASEEYLTALLNVCQGQYRNAFKCLRLVLELCLQGVYLSADLVELKEWLRNDALTNWGKLTDKESSPLSPKFCKAFFPEICEHSPHFLSLAKSVYKELSESIHGNVPDAIPLPDSFEFCNEVFNVWHEKAETVRLIVSFCFCVRYLNDLPSEQLQEIEPIILGQLDHIAPIRNAFGGPVES